MLRVGILGPGGIAARHAGAVAALPEAMMLAAVCGRDADRTSAFCAKYGGQAFTDLDAMIDAGIDLAIVTIPPFARSGEMEHLAARGVHLLVEKPLALDLATAESMASAVAASGVTAAVGFMYRHGDAVRRWREADPGLVGLFAGAYHCNALHAEWWRDKDKSGGQVAEQVIHQIDLIRHTMGDPDTVYARMANLFHRAVPGYTAEDVSAIVFGWDDGRIATLNASNIAVPGEWFKGWAIHARNMTGRFTSWNDAVFQRSDVSGAMETVASVTDPFIAQLADLADAVSSGRAPYVPLTEGVAATRLALAAVRSAQEGREIRIADV
jgi:predicted dehydrogenase